MCSFHMIAKKFINRNSSSQRSLVIVIVCTNQLCQKTFELLTEHDTIKVSEYYLHLNITHGTLVSFQENIS